MRLNGMPIPRKYFETRFSVRVQQLKMMLQIINLTAYLSEFGIRYLLFDQRPSCISATSATILDE